MFVVSWPHKAFVAADSCPVVDNMFGSGKQDCTETSECTEQHFVTAVCPVLVQTLHDESDAEVALVRWSKDCVESGVCKRCWMLTSAAVCETNVHRDSHEQCLFLTF